jgi:hypothetical protein
LVTQIRLLAQVGNSCIACERTNVPLLLGLILISFAVVWFYHIMCAAAAERARRAPRPLTLSERAAPS